MTVGRGPPAERTGSELLEFGVCNLDKPPGPSAHQVSGWVRDLVSETYGALATSEESESDGIDRAAHAGTLDPNVTGCLPVLTGTATRLSEALLTPKEYVSVLQVHRPIPADAEGILEEFVGPIYQKPPRKSAVSRRLRVREVYALDVLDAGADDRSLLLRIGCESGTYIRKLCHDLGLALGTGAHMGDLRRTRAAPFSDRDLVTLFDLADSLALSTENRASSADALSGTVQPAERALVHLPRVVIAESAARQVATGAPVYAPGVLDYGDPERPIAESETSRAEADEEPLVACYTPDEAVIALGALVGDPGASKGTVVETDRVLI